MTINPLGVALGFLNLAAEVVIFRNKNYNFGVMYIAYGIAGFAMAIRPGK